MSAEGYEPRFDLDAEVGRQGELFVTNIKDALARGSAEVKTDREAARTGNLYVEYECLRRKGWTPSGIQVTQADVWVFVLRVDELALVVSTATLRDISRRLWRTYRTECVRGSHPTKGVLVPIRLLIADQARRRPA
jgi:hypothetical protein